MHGRCATYDAYWHAFNIVKGRFEEGEHIIFSDDIYAYLYVDQLLPPEKWSVDEEWPSAEHIIAKDADMAYRYARFVLKSQWVKGEDAILSCARSSCLYAKHILKKPWFDAEKIISTSDMWSARYSRTFLGRPFIMDGNIASSSLLHRI